MSEFIKKHLYLIALALSVLFVLGIKMSSWGGQYGDSDGFMRALRIKHWIENPQFFEQVISESNYPFGEVNHWTRPMDVLWWLCYLPFSFFFALKDAIFLGGVFISPLIKIATAMVLVWGLKQYFSVGYVLFGLILFLNYPTGIFASDRPDHHSLMNLWLMVTIVWAMGWLKKKNDKYLLGIGFVLALSVWTAIEGFLLYVLVLSFWGYLYVFKKGSVEPLMKITKSFAVMLTFGWLLNPPYQGWLYADNGRISVLWVCLVWFGVMGVEYLKKTKPSTCIQRIVALLGMIISIIVLVIICFGMKVFYAPLTPEITQAWARHIKEMQPFYKLQWELGGYIYGFFVCAMGLNLYFVYVGIEKRLMVLNAIIGLPLFILSLGAVRFANYSVVVAILPWVVLIKHLYQKYPHVLNPKKDMPIYIWGMLGVLLLQILCALSFSLHIITQKPQPTFSYKLCSNIKNIGGVLVTNTFMGPKYMWRCEVNVVATPYHRNIEGIMDNYHILSGTSDEQIVPLLLKHQVRQIVVFDKYQKEFDETNEELLFNRLKNNHNVPDYLEAVPTDLKEIHHYKVKI